MCAIVLRDSMERGAQHLALAGCVRRTAVVLYTVVGTCVCVDVCGGRRARSSCYFYRAGSRTRSAEAEREEPILQLYAYPVRRGAWSYCNQTRVCFIRRAEHNSRTEPGHTHAALRSTRTGEAAPTRDMELHIDRTCTCHTYTRVRTCTCACTTQRGACMHMSTCKEPLSRAHAHATRTQRRAPRTGTGSPHSGAHA